MQIILTSASILHIKPEDLPVHKINVVGTALVSDPIVFTNLGIQFECIISDYIAKDKPTEIPIVLFHPIGSHLKSQTTMLKCGSSIFFQEVYHQLKVNYTWNCIILVLYVLNNNQVLYQEQKKCPGHHSHHHNHRHHQIFIKRFRNSSSNH